MPEYIYSCGEHRQEESHSMNETPVIVCTVCKKKMHRVPQTFAVNWNGLPPHLADSRPPAVQKFIDTATERRAKYNDRKEK